MATLNALSRFPPLGIVGFETEDFVHSLVRDGGPGCDFFLRFLPPDNEWRGPTWKNANLCHSIFFKQIVLYSEYYSPCRVVIVSGYRQIVDVTIKFSSIKPTFLAPQDAQEVMRVTQSDSLTG